MNTNYRFEFLYKGIHQYVVYIYAKDIVHAKNIARKILRDSLKIKLDIWQKFTIKELSLSRL